MMAVMDFKTVLQQIADAGMTQAEIAQKCGCKQASISDLSTGKTKQPNYQLGSSIVALHKKVMRGMNYRKTDKSV